MDRVSDRWECYSWAGPAIEERLRRDLDVASPPVAVVDWRRKPKSTLTRSCSTPEAAIGWFRARLAEWGPRITPADPMRMARLAGYIDHRQADPDLVHHCRFGPCDVLCRIVRHNRIVHWHHSVTGGEIAAWAIVPNHCAELAAARRPSPDR